MENSYFIFDLALKNQVHLAFNYILIGFIVSALVSFVDDYFYEKYKKYDSFSFSMGLLYFLAFLFTISLVILQLCEWNIDKYNFYINFI
jgi:hypothetical protein